MVETQNVDAAHNRLLAAYDRIMQACRRLVQLIEDPELPELERIFAKSIFHDIALLASTTVIHAEHIDAQIRRIEQRAGLERSGELPTRRVMDATEPKRTDVGRFSRLWD